MTTGAWRRHSLHCSTDTDGPPSISGAFPPQRYGCFRFVQDTNETSTLTPTVGNAAFAWYKPFRLQKVNTPAPPFSSPPRTLDFVGWLMPLTCCTNPAIVLKSAAHTSLLSSVPPTFVLSLWWLVVPLMFSTIFPTRPHLKDIFASSPKKLA